MPDNFIESSSESWAGRIGSSIIGFFVGILLIAGSIFLIFWNEGRAVTTAKSLKEGATAVVSAQPDAISPANDQKLIHLTGNVTAGEAISDPVFGLQAQALRIGRVVEMYQWKENKSEETHKKLGGGEETVTKYDYTKVWSNKPIDSTEFKHPEGHGNPANWPVQAGTTLNQKATLGAFKIPTAIIEKMSGDEPLPATQDSVAHAPAALEGKAKLNGDSIYAGIDPGTAFLGDLRISFKVLNPGTFSILAQQTGDTLAPYPTHAGRDIERVESGDMSAALMFQHAESENGILTWVLRAAGFILMWIGFALMGSPLNTLADVIPFIGSIVSFGTTLFAFIMAIVGSFIVAAVAWLAARPLLGGTLLVLAAVALVYGFSRVIAHHRQRTAGA